jgi:Amidohydrolase family
MYPDQNCLSRDEALRLYTQGSSWFSSESGKKGAITPGELADFVALTDDYFSVPEERIKSIESVLTVVGGKIVHATDEFAPHAPPPIPVLPEWSPVKVFGGYGTPLDVRKAAAPVCRCSSTNITPNVITTDATTRRINSWRASKPPAIATAGFLGRAATVLHSDPMKRARQKPGLNFKHHQGIMKQTVLITGT